MKILQSIQYHLSAMGLNSYQASQKFLFNKNNVIAIFLLCSAATSNLLYLYLEANDFDKYTHSIYSSSALVVATIAFLTVFSKMRQLFDCLEQMEKAVDSSKFCNLTTTRLLEKFVSFFWGVWQIFVLKIENVKNYRKNSFTINFSGLKYPTSKVIYTNTNPLVEKICKIIVWVAINVSLPIILFSKFILSFTAYFTTDLGNDVFELPFPYW